MEIKLKISRKQLIALVENVLSTRDLADAAVDKTTLTDVDDFKDPEMIMAQFHKLISAAGISSDNTKILASWLEALESRIVDLEKNILDQDSINESINDLGFVNRAQLMSGFAYAKVDDNHKSKIVDFLNNEIKINDEKFENIKTLKDLSSSELKYLYDNYKESNDIDSLLDGLRLQLTDYID